MTDYLFKYRELSEALYDSLVAVPFYITLEKTVLGNKDEKREAILKYMDYSMIEGENFGRTFIPPEHNFGVSVWLKPLADKVEVNRKNSKKEFIINHLGQNAWSCYESIVEYMSLKSKNLIPSGLNGIYLTMLPLLEV
jgi:hypothetical protein